MFTPLRTAIAAWAVAIGVGAQYNEVHFPPSILKCSGQKLGGGPHALWYVASCWGTDSAIFLPSKMTNDDGMLWWKEGYDAGNFTCDYCRILGYVMLDCSCPDHTGRRWNRRIDLTDHIANYGGQMTTNQDGYPGAQPFRTNVGPMPTDFSWNMYIGDESCYSGEHHPLAELGSNPDISCNEKPTDYPKGCSAEPTLRDEGSPYKCQSIHEPDVGDYWLAFQTVKVETEAHWNISFFHTTNCTGEPLRVMTMEDGLNECVTFDDYASSWTVLPTWYADW